MMNALLKALLGSEIGNFFETSSPSSPSSPKVPTVGDVGDIGDDISHKLSEAVPSFPSTVYSPGQDRERWHQGVSTPMPLGRCGALVCRTCGTHSPSPHRDECPTSDFAACRSRWFWLSPYGAIKCVACAAPADLRSVEAWVLARETGEGDDGFRIPSEILKLLHLGSPPQ